MATMKPGDFEKEVTKAVQSQNFSFLFGNGINHILLRSCFKWDEMLEAIGGKLGCKKEDGVNNTEFAGLIGIASKNSMGNADNDEKEGKKIEETQKVGMSINERIRDFINGRKSPQCKILDFAWDNGHHILTTNFDTELERYIQKAKNGNKRLKCHKVKASQGNVKASSNGHREYKWNSYWGVADVAPEKMPEGGHDIWHIHGRIDTGKSYSLIASMTKYCGAIRKVADMGGFTDKHWGGENTWLEYFIKCPLIIAGVDLGEQEIFPRFLLMRKAQWKEGKGLNQKSYFLVRKKEKENEEVKDGRNFLEALGFTIVEFDTYDQIYNHPLWGKLPATKKAK